MPSAGARIRAALVHVFTASGAVLAPLMVHFSYAENVQAVLWLFLAAMVIDGTDGFLARHFSTETLFALNMTLSSLWLASYAAITAQLENPQPWLVIASFAYPVYYTVVSLWLTFRSPR